MKLHLDVMKVDFDSSYNITSTRNTIRVTVDAIFKNDLTAYEKMKQPYQPLDEVYLPMTFTRVLVLYDAWFGHIDHPVHIPTGNLIYHLVFGCKEFDVITMDEYRKIPGSTYA